MTKKVSIKTGFSKAADDWVKADTKTNNESDEPTKRLTIDLPMSLHRRVKSQCADEGLKMNEAVIELLEKRFPEK
jgi:hypothetical protein